MLHRTVLYGILTGFMFPGMLCAQTGRDTTFDLNHRIISIHYPHKKISGLILMLPGWNYSRNKTCENSAFCTKALAAGYVLVCPEMGKSLYASAVFPETRKDWKGYPQLSFLTDTLQPFLRQSLHLLEPGSRDFVYGISTGARGAALLLEQSETIYLAGALLSGDYDPGDMQSDNLLKGYYGPYDQFRLRWEGKDNPLRNSDKLKMPLYIGHGQADSIVPPTQSKMLAEKLRKQGNKVIFSFKSGEQHNFHFWNSETNAILAFFESF
jgi:dienelactone hydrolase